MIGNVCNAAKRATIPVRPPETNRSPATRSANAWHEFLASGIVRECHASRRGARGAFLTTLQRILWLIVSAALAVLLYVAFRGYMAPGLLIDFANGLLC